MNRTVSDNESRTAALERRTAALEAADELAHSLDENTTALNRVRRRYRLTMALIVLVAATLFLEVKFNYDGNVSQCKNANYLRDQIDSKWDAITLFLEESRSYDDDPEGKAFLTLLSQDLARQDCSEIDWLGR